MIRRSGFLLIIVVPAVVLSSLYLFRNVLVTSVAQSALSRMVGAPVSIAGVDLAPFQMTAAFEQVRIVDIQHPERYLLVAGPGRFDLNGLQLFARKLVIDEMRLDGLAMGMPRPEGERTAQAPPAAPAAKPPTGAKPKAGASAKGDSAADDAGSLFSIDVELPKLDLDALTRELDVERITSGQQLASVKAVEQAEANAKQRLSQLQQDIAAANFEARFTALRGDMQNVTLKSSNLNEIRRSVETLQSLGKRTDALNNDVRRQAAATQQTLAEVRRELGQAGSEVSADLAAVRRLAGLGSLDVSRVGELLFGQVVAQRFNQIMGYLQRGRAMLASDDDSATSAVARREGRIITFPVRDRAYPTFLVELIDFNGFTPDREGSPKRDFRGTLRGLSSSAATYGEPVRLAVTAGRVGGERWDITGSFDHTADVGRDAVAVTGTRIDLGAMSLGGGRGGYLPHQVTLPQARVNLEFRRDGRAIHGQLGIDAAPVAFEFLPADSDSDPGLAGSMRELFAGIRTLDVAANIGGTFNKPEFSVTTSMDRVFSRHLNNLLGQRMAKVERDIRRDIEAQVQARRAEAQRAIEGPLQQANAAMAQAQQALKALQDRLKEQQREAERRLRNPFG